MKKKKIIYIVLALLLMCVGSYITYSIYRTNLSGNGTVTTSKWSIKVYKNNTSTEVANLNFGMSDITWTTHNGKNNTIAPGDSGVINYIIDASGSEVDVAYTVSVDPIQGGPDGLTVTPSPAAGTINYAAGVGNMTQTIALNVVWLGDDEDNSSKDTTDIASNNTNLTIPVRLTIRQNTTQSAEASYLYTLTENYVTIGEELDDEVQSNNSFEDLTLEYDTQEMENWGYDNLDEYYQDHTPQLATIAYLLENNNVSRLFIAFKKNNKIYYLEGGIDESGSDDQPIFERNVQTMIEAYGEENCSADEYDNYQCNNYETYVGTDGYAQCNLNYFYATMYPSGYGKMSAS